MKMGADSEEVYDQMIDAAIEETVKPYRPWPLKLIGYPISLLGLIVAGVGLLVNRLGNKIAGI